MSTETIRPLHFAGVLYTPQTNDRSVLRQFGETLKKRGFNIHGVVQHNISDQSGSYKGMDATDLKTGETFPLARPSKEDLDTGVCGFDVGLLTNCSGLLNRGIEERADLLIVEKFGEREQNGDGFMDEILKAAMHGVPTIVSVPAQALELWHEITGGLSTLVQHSSESLWKWWPKSNLYLDLALGVDDVEVKHIEIGAKTIFIETEKGCGAVQYPSNPEHQKEYLEKCESLKLREIALGIASQEDPFSRALGLCACLSNYNHYGMEGPSQSGLSEFDQSDDPVLIAGPFPKEKIKAPKAVFCTLDQALNTLSVQQFEGLIVPASTFREGQLPSLLEKKGLSRTVVVGPETPLSDRLYDYGLNMLAGRIIEDADEAAKLVAQGASVKDLKPVSRYVTLTKES